MAVDALPLDDETPAPFQLASLDPHIRAAEVKHGLPAGLLDKMIQKESSGNPNAVSPKGALGILQIMPDTAKELGVDPRDPVQAVNGAAAYLGRLNRNYGGDWNKTLAAYNWGPGNLAKYGFDKMPAETRDYVAKLAPQGAAAMDVIELPDEPVSHAMTASQGDVRKSEREQESFIDAWKRWQKAGGKMKPGQTLDAAVKEFAPSSLPREIARPGDVNAKGEVEYGNSVPGEAAKMVANAIGFATGGAIGATGMDTITRIVQLAYNVDAAVKQGKLTQEQADAYVQKELVTGGITDAALNTFIPMAGKLIIKIPGMKGAIERIVRAAGKGLPTGGVATVEDMAKDTATPEQRQLKDVIEERAKLASSPEQAQAVRELGARSQGAVPTPGAITDDASMAEATLRRTHPGTFSQGSKQLEAGAQDLMDEKLNPLGQPTREQMGNRIQELSKGIENAVKGRTANVFEKAKDASITVDMAPMRAEAQKWLDIEARTPGGTRMKPAEIAYLQKLVSGMEGEVGGVPAQPSTILGEGGKPAFEVPAVPGKPRTLVGADVAADMIGKAKGGIRDLTQDGVPSPLFKKILGNMVAVGDASYQEALRGAKPELAKQLIAAREDYKAMHGSLFEDALQDALQKEPEKVGQLFWQKGNVSALKQLDDMLAKAEKEGLLVGDQRGALSRDMMRGFLQEAVQTVDQAANWSTKMRDPRMRDTFNAFSRLAGTEGLADGMKVIEQAAKIAKNLRPTSEAGAMALGAKVSGGAAVGFGAATGSISLPVIAAGISLERAAAAMATAYNQGNKGIIRDLGLVLTRGQQPVTAAGAAGVKEAAARVAAWAEQNGLPDIFALEKK